MRVSQRHLEARQLFPMAAEAFRQERPGGDQHVRVEQLGHLVRVSGLACWQSWQSPKTSKRWWWGRNATSSASNPIIRSNRSLENSNTLPHEEQTQCSCVWPGGAASKRLNPSPKSRSATRPLCTSRPSVPYTLPLPPAPPPPANPPA